MTTPLTTPVTMSALLTGVGPALVPSTVDAPRPGPTQLLVRASAWALDNADLATLTGEATEGPRVR